METVEIEAIGGGRGKHWYRYNVYWKGRQILHLSTDPELDAARALRLQGVKGPIAVVDRRTGQTRSYTSTPAGSLQTEETVARRPHFRKRRENRLKVLRAL